MTIIQMLQVTWFDDIKTILLLIVAFSISLLTVKDEVVKRKRKVYRLR